MSLHAHLQELERKHRALDTKILEEARHPGVSDVDIRTLKKRKLLLKEEIERTRSSAA